MPPKSLSGLEDFPDMTDNDISDDGDDDLFDDDEETSDDSDAPQAKRQKREAKESKPSSKKPAAKKSTASQKEKKSSTPKSFVLTKNDTTVDYFDQFCRTVDEKSFITETGYHVVGEEFRTTSIQFPFPLNGKESVAFARGVHPDTKGVQINKEGLHFLKLDESRTKFTTTTVSLPEGFTHPPPPASRFSFDRPVYRVCISDDGSMVAFNAGEMPTLFIGSSTASGWDIKKLDGFPAGCGLRNAVFHSASGAQGPQRLLLPSCGRLLDVATGSVTAVGGLASSACVWHRTLDKLRFAAIIFNGRSKRTLQVSELDLSEAAPMAVTLSDFPLNMKGMGATTIAVDDATGYCAVGGDATPELQVWDLNETKLVRGRCVGKIACMATTISFRVGAGSKYTNFASCALPTKPFPTFAIGNSNNSDEATCHLVTMKPSQRSVKAPVSAKTLKKKRNAAKRSRRAALGN